MNLPRRTEILRLPRCPTSIEGAATSHRIRHSKVCLHNEIISLYANSASHLDFPIWTTHISSYGTDVRLIYPAFPHIELDAWAAQTSRIVKSPRQFKEMYGVKDEEAAATNKKLHLNLTE